ncbi:tRNA (adenosine(37)-N6)-threonylcarbamoyltransferase complex transferase subunit TsaD [Simkania negevensis]|uniref:tRNA N6-adenosine threonylcarbamoyltransferase n=1 Tax=Simkania negevensis TaxID=83561 RepID=A0ABS3AR88_9BACT|nr:tRNA (adenosine(37)-N6)-threonylcarbamoyltransferase complex transferase subunit TsaD [Simkania negevensis]
MNVLGIETTCDETACAIVRDGTAILSNAVTSQIDLHNEYGGVVPELACRRHIDVIIPVIDEALKEAKLSLAEIDLIAVAYGPGLIGALIIGVTAAKALSTTLDIPFVGVNHIEAHLYASMMHSPDTIAFPALGLILSGGHTTMLKIDSLGDYKLIGQTLDDAIGEAFDKVAQLLGLPYPGGPHIEALAKKGDPTRYSFKSGQIKGRPYDFSFSGLKTRVLYTLKGTGAKKNSTPILDESEYKHIAASFQHAAIKDVTKKAEKAAKEHQCKSIVLGGGVTHNQALRTALTDLNLPIPIYWPPQGLSLDNAAMIAGLGYHNFLKNNNVGDDLALLPMTRIPF